MKILFFLFLIIFFTNFMSINIFIEENNYDYIFSLVSFVEKDQIQREKIKVFTESNNIQNSIIRAYYKHQIDPKLICSVISVESRFDSLAVSMVGAKGLMQVMESTAYLMQKQNLISENFDLFSVQDNIDIGTAVLKHELGKFSLRAALAAYNCGHYGGKMWATNRSLLPKETQEYPLKVLSYYRM